MAARQWRLCVFGLTILWIVYVLSFVRDTSSEEISPKLVRSYALPVRGSIGEQSKSIDRPTDLVQSNAELKSEAMAISNDSLLLAGSEPDRTGSEVNKAVTGSLSSSDVASHVHTFYYPWYCNEEVDGEYHHWNHEFIPHWDVNVARRFPTGQHDPNFDDIGSTFFPALGAYSSADPAVVERHMEQMASAGIGVVVVSWYPPGRADENGKPWDAIIPMLLSAAQQWGLCISFHIEPYQNRTPATVREDLHAMHSLYGEHAGLCRMRRPGSPPHSSRLPLVYVYDSYHNPPREWSGLLADGRGEGAAWWAGGGGVGTGLNVRGTSDDVVAIALLVESKHTSYITEGGFDGLYTYFGAEGFTYGSTWRQWGHLAKLAHSMNKLFVPSVAPGYDDTRVRPWNGAVTRPREAGAYYDRGFAAALAALEVAADAAPPRVSDVRRPGGALMPEGRGGLRGQVNEGGVAEPLVDVDVAWDDWFYVSITSFNEWHEGTQIEPAIARATKSGAPTPAYSYPGYDAAGNNNENESVGSFYLERTRGWVTELSKMRSRVFSALTG